MLNQFKRPIILVDWSDVNSTRKFHMLTASLAIKGRSLTIYEACHPIEKLSSAKVHESFLKNLSSIIPSSCRPIIVTDAGFRTPWFNVVEALGWDYIGRLRSNTKIRGETTDSQWISHHMFYICATNKPYYFGEIELTKSKQFHCHAYLYRAKRKGRFRKGRMGKPSLRMENRINAKRQRDPWFIVSSLSPKDYTVVQLMLLYSKRMQIEESFRDRKSLHYGLGFQATLSVGRIRLENLMLLTTLALFILWIIGMSIKLENKHWQFQANSTKHRNVLSVSFLAKLAMRGPPPYIPQVLVKSAIQQIRAFAHEI